MKLAIEHIRTIKPLDAARVNTLFEALWCYVLMVGGITLLSIVTGILLAWVFPSEVAIVGMRLINGGVTAWLGLRILKAKGLQQGMWLGAVAVAAVLSASGLEILGLVVIVWFTTHPHASVKP
jgi:hypothetical protein